jgi:hypothetical protein
MAIEELKSIYRPVTLRREKDADSSRRERKGPPPPQEKDETTDPDKGKVDIKV